MEYLKYDPNYADDMDEDDDDNEFDDDDDDIDSDAEYSDDEDMSWKVRRASSKCISALFISRPDLMVHFYKAACGLLITRLKEREESVKLDVFVTFNDMLRQTASYSKLSGDKACLEILSTEVPRIVKTLCKELKGKSIKPKVSCFTLLQVCYALIFIAVC